MSKTMFTPQWQRPTEASLCWQICHKIGSTGLCQMVIAKVSKQVNKGLKCCVRCLTWRNFRLDPKSLCAWHQLTAFVQRTREAVNSSSAGWVQMCVQRNCSVTLSRGVTPENESSSHTRWEVCDHLPYVDVSCSGRGAYFLEWRFLKNRKERCFNTTQWYVSAALNLGSFCSRYHHTA